MLINNPVPATMDLLDRRRRRRRQATVSCPIRLCFTGAIIGPPLRRAQTAGLIEGLPTPLTDLMEQSPLPPQGSMSVRPNREVHSRTPEMTKRLAGSTALFQNLP